MEVDQRREAAQEISKETKGNAFLGLYYCEIVVVNLELMSSLVDKLSRFSLFGLKIDPACVHFLYRKPSRQGGMMHSLDMCMI
jgi:hypothetical protein